MAKRSPNQPIRVLVVEDSRSQRELLVGLLRAEGMDVVGVAGDGAEAVAATQRLRPHVIAMDIHLPGLDGYAATRQIMQSCPTPIVLISSAAGDDQQRAVAALSAGALAVVRKPGSPSARGHADERANFLTTLRLMADVLVVTRHPERASAAADLTAVSHSKDQETGRPAGDLSALFAHSSSSRSDGAAPQVLALAASTGGPAAVQALLVGLGADFPLPVLLVQHIARGFVGSLAEWLDATTPLTVQIAGPNERLLPGRVYLAPDDQHLLVRGRGFAALRADNPPERFCPSADVLFEVVAAVYGAQALGVVLTGMGDDGARGLRALRAAGGHTLAQDEASSVVYGMPRAAAAAGAVGRVAPLANIAPAILSYLGRSEYGTATE